MNKTHSNRLIWQVLGLLISVYILTDLTRKLFNLSSTLYVIQDFLILVLYLTSLLSWISRSSRSKQATVKTPFSKNPALIVYILLLCAALIISSFWSRYSNLLLTILGNRTYLFALPMLLLGYFLARDLEDKKFLYRADRFISVVLWAICLVAIVQFFGNLEGVSILPAIEHEFRSFYTTEIPLISSVFVSSKKFARFALLLFIMVWMIRKTLNRKLRYTTLVVFLSILISGSRESIVLFAIFVLLSSLLFSSSSRIGWVRLSSPVRNSVVIMAVFLILGVLASGLERFQYIFAVDDPLNYVRRGAQFLSFIWIDWGAGDYWIGSGPGSYGQETGLVPGVREQIAASGNGVFDLDVAIGQTLLTVADSGFTRIIVELGVIGLLAFIILFVFVFNMTRTYLVSNKSLICFALAWIQVIWVVLFLKSHQVLADILISSIFYCSLSAMLKICYDSDRERPQGSL